MLKIALRNVFRNRRRSLLSLSLIALGGAILFLAGAYFDDTIFALRWAAAYQYGHLQIAAAGYWEGSSKGYEHLISKDLLERIAAILTKEDDVERFTTQLGLSGLIGTERKSAIFVASGVEPGNEIGEFPLEEGEELAPGDKAQALIGEGMAENLGVEVGDYLTVMGTTIDGAYNAGALQVKGIFEWWQAEVNNQFAVVPLFFAQRMLNTDTVEKVLVELRDLEATGQVAERLNERFATEGLPLGSYEATITVDPNDVIKETDERDNALRLPFSLAERKVAARAGPELHPIGLTFTPKSPIEQGQQVLATATIENSGDQDAGAFRVEFGIRPEGSEGAFMPFAVRIVSELRLGKTVEVQGVLSTAEMDPGVYEVRVTITGTEPPEQDRNNNALIAFITITKPPEEQ
jgi:hypothetical protein